MPPNPMVTVAAAAVIHAVRHGHWAERYYLDVIDGNVVRVSERIRAILQDVYDTVGEEAAGAYLDTWEHAEIADLRLAHAVEMDDDRYRKLPEMTLAVRLRWMDAFTGTVRDRALRRMLVAALESDDPARFERALALEPAQQRRWEQFTVTQIRALFADWQAREQIAVRLSAT